MTVVSVDPWQAATATSIELFSRGFTLKFVLNDKLDYAFQRIY